MSTGDEGGVEAVLVTRRDWQNLERQKPEDVQRVLALTPNARALAAGGPWPVVDPMTRFTDCAEARSVARVRRARRATLENLGPLPAAEREVLIDQINRVAYGAYRLWFLLGSNGAWLVPSGHSFTLKTRRMEAFETLLKHFLAPKMESEARAMRLAPPPLAGLYRLLRRMALRRHPGSRARIVMGAAKEQFGLAQAFEQDGLKVRRLVVSTAVGGWREYLKLAREIGRNSDAGGMVQVALSGAVDAAAAGLADRALAAMSDPVIRPALALYRDVLAYKFARLPSLRADAARVVRRFAPDVFTAAEVSGLSNWLLAEACGEGDVPRLVLGRNAHAAPASALARDGCVGYFKARYPDGLVDEPFLFSPAGAEAARQALPAGLKQKIRPILARPVAAPPQPSPRAAERLILLADTYAAWWFPHSYVFLTGDGFVAAARALAQAVAGLADTKLVIRGKQKPECDLEALTTLVEAGANCEIKMRDAPFEEDLAAADLLVSFRSTTIEEAIFARKPVLLWGATSRYAFLPAREEPPSADERAALYRVRRAERLGAMIEAILDAHAGRPLDDDELAPYCWPAGTPGIGDLARELVARAAAHSISNHKEAPYAAI